MDNIHLRDIIGGLFGSAAAIMAAAYAIKKYMRAWGDEDVQNDITHLLREEVERLAIQNRMIATELNSLQTEILALNKQLHVLSAENGRLHEEVSDLNFQVDRLHKILDVHNITMR